MRATNGLVRLAVLQALGCASALLLATLGIIVYFALIRSIMKGPMLAQILGTFGLALLLRYAAFWWFGANFLVTAGKYRRRHL